MKMTSHQDATEGSFMASPLGTFPKDPYLLQAYWAFCLKHLTARFRYAPVVIYVPPGDFARPSVMRKSFDTFKQQVVKATSPVVQPITRTSA
jgi:hypothetical protein